MFLKSAHFAWIAFWICLIAVEFEPSGIKFSWAAEADVPAFEANDFDVLVAPATEEDLGPNLVANPGFEILDGDRPKGWEWRLRGADADYQIVSGARSGNHAIRIRNRSPKASNVFGQMILGEALCLEPGQTYTLSAFVKSEDPGITWIGGGGKSWWVRLQLEKTRNQWQRFEKSFTATGDDALFRLMIVTTSPTKGVMIDDIKLEKGEKATSFFDPSTGNAPLMLISDVPGDVAVFGDEVLLDVFAYLRPGAPSRPITVELSSLSGKWARRAVAPGPSEGLNCLSITWKLGDRHKGRYRLEVKSGGQRETAEFRLYTPSSFDAAHEAAKKRTQTLHRLVNEAVLLKLPVAYPKAALAVSRRFSGLAVKKREAGLLAEAVRDLQFIGDLCAEQARELRAVKKGEKVGKIVPDPPLARIAIHDGNFWVDEEPVMLVGAMGWGELESELSVYRDFGFNSIGDDYNAFSSFRMLTGESSVDETAVPRLVENWNRLHEMNLAVSYTPHLTKIPEWAFEKYPDIIGGRTLDDLPRWPRGSKRSGRGPGLYGRFFPFAIDSPNLRRLVERYYATLFPSLEDIPGFRVIWLMNEPAYQSGDAHYVELFRKYLEQKFGKIENLNAAWKSAYKGFEAIDCPSASTKPDNFDWLTFHQGQVSEWFEWLSGQIKRHDPQAILSNKPSAGRFFKPHLGIDFEREALLWDIPGSDTMRRPSHWRYAYAWSARSIMLLDFQKSVAPHKPLADHEFHYVHEPGISEKYVRAAYFHSYLHGLRMSQFWIWATGDFRGKSASPGLNYTAWSQPKAAWGTASAALDLRRLARHVAAFPPKPQVLLYFSRPSLFLLGDDYADVLTQTYEAANGLDAPVGFITDRMIQSGGLSQCRLLVVAGAEFIEEDTRAAILDFLDKGGRMALAGDCLMKNEYGKAFLTPLHGTNRVIYALRHRYNGGRLEALAFQLDKLYEKSEIPRPIRVLQPGGQPAWPVESRSVPTENGMLVYIIGLNKTKMDVMLSTKEKVAGWCDVISGEKGNEMRLEIKPLDIRLLEIPLQP